MAEEKVMVSACLAGVNCVYDGSNKYHPFFGERAAQKRVFLFCPESLGGMEVPHPPSEIKGGDGRDVIAGRAVVLSKTGVDVSDFFIEGAQRSLELARRRGVTRVVLKARSPSCGCGRIYDGTFTRTQRDGDGVTTALLRENGIDVISDEEYLRSQSPKSQGPK